MDCDYLGQGINERRLFKYGQGCAESAVNADDASLTQRARLMIKYKNYVIANVCTKKVDEN